jgi:hypothetical protein
MTQADLDAMLREIEEEKPPASMVSEIEAEKPPAAMSPEIEAEKPPAAMSPEIEEESPPSSIFEDARSVPGRGAEIELDVEDAHSVSDEGAETELDALLREVESIKVPSEAEVIEPEMNLPDPDRPETALDDDAFGATPLVLGLSDAAAEEMDPNKLRETIKSVLEEVLPRMVRPIIVAEIQEIIKALKKSPDS